MEFKFIGTCKECKFWDGKKCNQLDLMRLTFDEYYNQNDSFCVNEACVLGDFECGKNKPLTQLLTGPDFGCINWKAKKD